jgi:hypothetical protein
MLNPRFFAIPSDIKLEPWQKFRVMGYAQTGDWVLVKWQITIGSREAYRWQSGETLYHGETAIEGGRLEGSFNLYQTPAIEQTGTPLNQSVWDRIDRRIGQHGIPPAIAAGLRNPRNYRCFQV